MRSSYGTQRAPVRPNILGGAAPNRKNSPTEHKGGWCIIWSVNVRRQFGAYDVGRGLVCSSLLAENGLPRPLVGGGLCAAHLTEATVRSSGACRLAQSAFNPRGDSATGRAGRRILIPAGCRPSQLSRFGRRPSPMSEPLGTAGRSTLDLLGQSLYRLLTDRPGRDYVPVTGNSNR